MDEMINKIGERKDYEEEFRFLILILKQIM